ncbi:hypothetical protein [Actinomadura hibisca]|uniref:hypothetical protein n=1 Tax=Actinomadura hibisca TaxID=68565 RepID=UPI000829E90B|nr:hypothetical protein [Actinomadura hibisca]
MTVQEYRLYEVSCDFCVQIHETQTTYDTVESARADAIADGWDVHDSNEARCPRCKRAEHTDSAATVIVSRPQYA